MCFSDIVAMADGVISTRMVCDFMQQYDVNVSSSKTLDERLSSFWKLSEKQILTRILRALGASASVIMSVSVHELSVTLINIACIWACDGFRDFQCKWRASLLFELAYATLHLWSWPEHLKGCRWSADIFNPMFALSSVLGLRRLMIYNHCKHHYRVILRGFPVHIQMCLLHGVTNNRFWVSWISKIQAICTKNSVHEAVCYVLLHKHRPQWYVGKANCIRKRHASTVVGPAYRLSEHVFATIRNAWKLSHRPHYMAWAGTSPSALYMIPCMLSSEANIFQHEWALIHALSPPGQASSVVKCRVRHDRDRTFPRFREFPSVEDELKLNVQAKIKDMSNVPFQIRRMARGGINSPLNFCGVSGWFQKHMTWTKRRVKDAMKLGVV